MFAQWAFRVIVLARIFLPRCGIISFMLTPAEATALDLSRDLLLTPGNLARVAKATNSDLSRWAFEQWELRRKARTKFALAHEMLFVKEALEQATHERVARHHADFFPANTPVWDLTAGIGADLIALAARGPVIACELDSTRAHCARHNLEAHDLSGTVLEADCLLTTKGQHVTHLFVDPARRVEGKRTLSIEEFSPRPRDIVEMFSDVRLGVMKLSPMLRDDELESLGTGLEFVSFEGECREAIVFFGKDAPVGRWAAQVGHPHRLQAGADPTEVETPQEFLFDADPAAVRAHAVGNLASSLGLQVLGGSRGYLTGPEPVDSPWLRPYRVLHHGKADPKTTKRVLRELGAATPELKQRGAGLDLIAERAKYKSDGERWVSLVIWPVGRSLRHTIVERL